MLGHIKLKSPSQYKKYKDVFGKKNVDTLPKQRSYDCTIDFKKGVQLPFGPIYNLSQDKFVVFQSYINEHLENLYLTFQISN
jgi:hypothetical protein